MTDPAGPPSGSGAGAVVVSAPSTDSPTSGRAGPASDKAVLAARVRRRGMLYQAEHTLRGMRAYAVVILSSSLFQPVTS